MYKRKKPRIVDRIKTAILENKTFSLHIDNDKGFKIVAEMITYYLLREHDERDRLLMFADLLPKVKNALHPALKELEGEGYKVMRGPIDGRLKWVTVDIKYRQSIQTDTERVSKQLCGQVRSKIKHLAVVNPSALPDTKDTLRALANNIHSPKRLSGAVELGQK